MNASNPTLDVNKIGMKVPQFSTTNVKLYFAQLEANFSIANITEEKTKFSYLVAAIDTEYLKYVSDVVFDPPAQNPYSILKEKLLEQFEHSENKKLKTLLQDLTLGDKKPSQLLHEMRELSNNKLDDSFLKNLWFGHLPNHMQAILATSNENLSQLALMADKISEVTQNSSIAAVTNSNIHSDSSETIARLERQVQDLTLKIDKLCTRQSRAKYRNFSTSRSRSKSVRRSVKDSTNTHGVCWYHRTFADKATKCRPPCNFDSKNSGGCQ